MMIYNVEGIAYNLQRKMLWLDLNPKGTFDRSGNKIYGK